jgi:NADH-quinone oxidoreductase subunit N
MVYMFMNLGAFMFLGLLSADSGSERIEAFTGIGWRDPATTASLTICLVSLIGLPPLGGFIVKWWLIYALGSAAHAQENVLLWILVIAIVINTAISLFYYTRILRQMYLRGEDVVGGGLRAPVLGKGLVHLCAVVLLLTGTLLIPWLKNRSDNAARQVYTAQAPAASVDVARQSP